MAFLSISLESKGRYIDIIGIATLTKLQNCRGVQYEQTE